MIRHARRTQIPDIAAIWTDAFAHDPYFRWIQPDDGLWPAFGNEWMTFIAELCFERGHTFVDDDHRCAVAWIPPDVAFVDADGIARGRGIIAKHDRESTPCALVSTNTRNVSFYESLGFRVDAEVPVASGVTVMRAMHRD